MAGHRTTLRRELYANGVKFKISYHAAKRCNEMGVSAEGLLGLLTEGKLMQHTPKSKHYKNGRGWIIEGDRIAAGLARDDENEKMFTVVTLLWRKPGHWHEWFDQGPKTNRQRREDVTPMESVEDKKESA